MSSGKAEEGLKHLDGAEELLRRGLAVREKALGENHPDVLESLDHLAGVESELGRKAEATASSAKRAAALREKRATASKRDETVSLEKLIGGTVEAGRPAETKAPIMQSKQIKMH